MSLPVIDPDKIVFTCQTSNTICSILSNVTAFAKDLILRLFPQSFFKNIFITTSSASSQQADLEDNELPIKEYPQLSIAPIYYPAYEDTIGTPNAMWRRGFYMGFRTFNERYGYKRVFYDEDEELRLSAIPNRLKIGIEYKIKVRTHLKKIEVLHMMRQKFYDNDRIYWNNVLLESQIPGTLIKAIANIKGFDLETKEGIDGLLKYLSVQSGGNITTKIDLATGNTVFCWLYSANILVSTESAPESDGRNIERINMADNEGAIEMTLGLELWSPNNYVFECKNLPEGDYLPVIDDGRITVEGMFKLVPPKFYNDFILMEFRKFTTDVNISVEYIKFDVMLYKNILELCDARKQANDYTFFDEVFKVKLFREDADMVEGKDYTVDWETYTINILNPRFNFVYGVGIYADTKVLFNMVNPEVNTPSIIEKE